MSLLHFPFPERSSEQEKDVYFIKSQSTSYLSQCYLKNTSSEAIIISTQFFSIEEIFQMSFQYVTPTYLNRDSSSSRFATIIRESCNLYEILCRKVYSELFNLDLGVKLNIFNYLSLDYFFKLRTDELRSPVFHSYMRQNSILNPFYSLSGWEGNKKLEGNNIPKWWDAYNKIKHDVNDSNKYANLDNAFYSFAALFMVIRKVYGDGLICGYLRKPTSKKNMSYEVYPIRTSNIFIGEVYYGSKN
ncbi:MAG: hypothetical protein PF448_06445 [Bacteroidales bacterium]|jgi:hypothetical protein|nr:hypothetical protein [Bacteroidales bacterium]